MKGFRLHKRYWIAYLIFIHLLLAIVLLKSNFVEKIYRRFHKSYFSDYYETVLKYHLRIDAQVPPGAVIFIGDSMVQGLCVSAITEKGVNFGIGGDTVEGILYRLPLYTSIKKASAIVVELGINNVLRESIEELRQKYEALFKFIPRKVPLILCGILPVDENIKGEGWNSEIQNINQQLRFLCEKYDNCIYIDLTDKLVDATGNLKPEYHVGDGTHLSPSGYRVWSTELKKTLAMIEKTSILTDMSN